MRPLNGTVFRPAGRLARLSVPARVKRVQRRCRRSLWVAGLQRLPTVRPGSARSITMRELAASESLKRNCAPRRAASIAVALRATRKRLGVTVKPETVGLSVSAPGDDAVGGIVRSRIATASDATEAA